MGKAKEIAELGDKITVSGGTVTVADISTSTFSGTSIHSMQDVDLTGIANNMFLKYNLSNTQFEVVAGNTSSIDEGTNLYYTDARVGTYISGDRTYGNITTTGYIAGPASLTIDPAGVGDNTGTVVIAGNLQVDGTTTTINSTTMTVDDLNLTLASGAANAAAANGAGITIDGANATITYDSSNDEFDFNKNINLSGNTAYGTFDGTLLGDVSKSSTLSITNTQFTDRSVRFGTYSNDSASYFGPNNDVASDELIDLGTSDGAWRNLHISGQANVGTLVSTVTGGSLYTSSAGGIPRLYLGGGSGFGINRQSTSEDIFFGEPGDTGTWRVRGAGTISLGVGSTSTSMVIQGNGGNVGIGTGSPSYPLDVNGGTENVVARISSTDADALIVFEDNSTTDTVLLGAQGEDFLLRTDLGKFTFKVNNNATDGMVILNNGNVGIGTTSPSRQLHVNNASESNIRLQGGSDYAELRVKDADNALSFHYGGSEAMRMNASGGITVNNAQNSNINFTVKSGQVANALFVDGVSGDVGIGTSTTVAPLNIQADGDARTIRIIGRSDDYSEIDFYENDNSTILARIQAHNTMFNLRAYSVPMQFQQSGVTKMVLTTDGKVGIGGNATVSANLDVRLSRTDTDPLLGLFSQQSSGYDARVMVGTIANSSGDPYLKFDAGGSNMIVGEFWKGTTDNELRMGVGERPSDSGFRGIRIDGSGQTYDESGIFSPMFYLNRNYANVSGSGASGGTWGTGSFYTDLTADGDFLNLKDHPASGLQSWFHGAFSPNYSTSTWRQDIRAWQAIRILAVVSRTGNSYDSTSVVFNYKRYFYSGGWADMSSTYDTTFTGTDSDRGRRWLVMPWIDYSDFPNGADVPGLGLVLKTSNGVDIRVGACYVQYRYKNAASGV